MPPQTYTPAKTGISTTSADVTHSTNTLERLNKEVKRRADVVGIFPSENPSGKKLNLLNRI